MKITKIISNVINAIIIIVAILVLVSIFPVTGNHKILVVKSGSMEPAIKTGSVVFVSPQKEYKINDIITFAGRGNKESSITHRVIDIEDANGKKNFVTKGDANNAEDESRVALDGIIGKVSFSVPYAGYIVVAAKQPLGFTLLIIFPAGLIIFEEIGKIRKEIKLSRKKKKDGV